MLAAGVDGVLLLRRREIVFLAGLLDLQAERNAGAREVRSR